MLSRFEAPGSGFTAETSLRNEAMRKDEENIAKIVKEILGSEKEQETVLSLRGVNAEPIMDILQDVSIPNVWSIVFLSRFS
jgi:hypothetical protein